MPNRLTNSEWLRRYTKRPLFYITSLENLPSIVSKGILSHDKVRGIPHKDISNKIVNSRRSRPDPIFDRPIHYYVPLFFRANNPMLFALKEKQGEFGVLHVDTNVTDDVPECLFTDGNAASDTTTFFKDFSELDKLCWDVLNQDRWTRSDHPHKEKRRIRNAEVLIPEHIPFRYVSAIAVKNNRAIRRARIATKKSRKPVEIISRPNWFIQCND